MSRWLKTFGRIVLGVALILGFLYGWLTSNYMKKPAFYAHSVAADIASGVLRADEGYDYDKARKRLGDAPACIKENLPLPYYACVLTANNHYQGCGTWSNGSTCVSLWTDIFLLNEPKRLGGVIDSLAHPCRHLPSPEDIDGNSAIEQDSRKFLKQMWKEALCDSHQSQFPGRVILTFSNNGLEEFRIIKP